MGKNGTSHKNIIGFLDNFYRKIPKKIALSFDLHYIKPAFFQRMDSIIIS